MISVRSAAIKILIVFHRAEGWKSNIEQQLPLCLPHLSQVLHWCAHHSQSPWILNFQLCLWCQLSEHDVLYNTSRPWVYLQFHLENIHILTSGWQRITMIPEKHKILRNCVLNNCIHAYTMQSAMESNLTALTQQQMRLTWLAYKKAHVIPEYRCVSIQEVTGKFHHHW